MSDETADLKAECLRETAKALLVRVGSRELWVPKSLVDDDSEVFDADENATGKLVVPLWWAEKEGLL